MARNASALLAEFHRRAKALDRARKRSEQLLSSGIAQRTDVELQYESLFINLVKAFENAIEKLFLGLMAGSIASRLATVRPIASAASVQSARRIVAGDRSYVDWLPYDRHTRKRAKAYFSKGLPFSRISKQSLQRLEQVSLIRNAIAHESTHSRRMFEVKVIGSTPLGPRDKTPAGFLRSIHAHNPSQSRFELYSAFLVQAGREFFV